MGKLKHKILAMTTDSNSITIFFESNGGSDRHKVTLVHHEAQRLIIELSDTIRRFKLTKEEA